MDMIFGTWNVRSLYRAGSKELSKYKLGLVEVAWLQDPSEIR
jgi:hypothetical protein